MRWLLLPLLILAAFLAEAGKKVFPAELPIPRPRPAIEECSHPGNHPAPGQQLTPDQACPSEIGRAHV